MPPKSRSKADITWPATGPNVVTGSAGQPIYRKPVLVSTGPVAEGAVMDDAVAHHLLFALSHDEQDAGSTVWYRLQMPQDALFRLLWDAGALTVEEDPQP